MQPVKAFRRQEQACADLGSPMYAELLGRLADDIETGGPTAEILRGHEDDPGPSALALRLLGSVHRLVLERRAGALGAFYPSVGGRWEPDGGAAAFLALLDSEPDAVREWLDRPPQTNEVGRAAALMGGLLHLPEWAGDSVRLFEIGSSAAPLSWRSGLRFDHRIGCDTWPVDVATTEGRLTLTAYVWPDQTQRLERLRAALAMAQDDPPVVRRFGAADFVERIALSDTATTVLWHSVMWQYLTDTERDRISVRIQELGERGEKDGLCFAHLFLEPTRRTPEGEHEFLVVLTTWPEGERRILGRAAPHGVPVTWERDET